MADEQDQATENAAGQEGGFPLTVVTQYLKDMSFENPNGAEILTTLKEVPTGTIRVDVRVDPKTPPDVEVTLFLSVEAKAGDKAVYMVETEYAGIFRIGRVPQEVVLPLIMIEAPRLLFPFARNLIALAIQSGGFPPLFINPIDFAALYRDKREQLMAQGGDGNPTVN
ncbi:MAG TPA: protein-export chaperone SecB [Dongiaceae bacterium]|jgi:preprotein translocase subunit SecB